MRLTRAGAAYDLQSPFLCAAAYFTTSSLATLLTTECRNFFRGKEKKIKNIKRNKTNKKGGQWSDQPVAYCPARLPGFYSSSGSSSRGSIHPLIRLDLGPSPSSLHSFHLQIFCRFYRTPCLCLTARASTLLNCLLFFFPWMAAWLYVSIVRAVALLSALTN